MKNIHLVVLYTCLFISASLGAQETSIAKRGFFLEGNLGVFSEFIGYQDSSTAVVRTSRALSAVQPFVALVIGYDVMDFLSLGIRLADGFVSRGARIQDNPEAPTDFSLMMADVILTGAIPLVERLQLTLSAFGGFSFIMPSIEPQTSPYAGNAGASIGLRLDTFVTNMVVGIDFSGYATILPRAPAGASMVMWAASIAPVLKYVF